LTAQRDQTRATAGVESTRTPSMSTSRPLQVIWVAGLPTRMKFPRKISLQCIDEKADEQAKEQDQSSAAQAEAEAWILRAYHHYRRRL
jgi:hypothetical protein